MKHGTFSSQRDQFSKSLPPHPTWGLPVISLKQTKQYFLINNLINYKKNQTIKQRCVNSNIPKSS